jgi:hypothetical protein
MNAKSGRLCRKLTLAVIKVRLGLTQSCCGNLILVDCFLSVVISPEYTVPIGKSGGFILMHLVGNVPSATEIDVPLTYANYYYVEALKRYKAITGI